MSIVIRHFLTFLHPCRKLAVLFFLAAGIELIVLSLAPLSFKFMIDQAVEPRDRSAFFLILGIFGILGALGIAGGLTADRLLARILAHVQQHLRRRLFMHMQRLGIDQFQSSRAGEHLSRFTVDLPAIERAMMSLMTLGLQSLAVVGISVTILFALKWSMALLILGGAGLIYLGPHLLGGKARKAYSAYRDELEAVTSEIQENVRGQMVIQGFQIQDQQIHRFENRLRSLWFSHYRHHVMQASLDRLPFIGLLLVNFSIIAFGSYLALAGSITLGTLVAFFTIYTSMGNAVYNLTAILPAIASARVSLEQITGMLTDPDKPGGSIQRAALLTPGPEITADRLVFGYPGKVPLLSGISFTIPAGSTAAFVGPSGSGKSTVIQLILGLRQPSGGSIKINGTDLLEIPMDAYRRRVGTVFQESFLFYGTLRDNILIGKPDATMEEIVQAAEQASIHGFITRLPDGYDTLVQEEGSNLSGGQKQRIAIARALLRDPSLLLLDEVTSSLDPLSEAAVMRTLRAIRKQSGLRTTILVSHRLAAIADADVIFVMNEGSVMDSGRHEELLGRCELYQQLWDQQDQEPSSLIGKEA